MRDDPSSRPAPGQSAGPPTGADAACRSGPWGFGGRLTREFPSQINVDVTELCNLACRHCPHPDFRQSSRYGGRSLPPSLNAKLVEEARGERRAAAQHIRYTGEGEPLLHPDIFDMIAVAVDRSRTFVSLTTNGTLLTPARIEKLLATGIGLVDVSVDAFSPETYAAIRLKGELDVTRGNTRNLIRRARELGATTAVVVSYVEQPANQHETKRFEAYWRDEGVDRVVVRRLHSAAGALIPVAALKRGDGVADARPRYPCLYPWERIVLTPTGMLAFCPTDWSGASIVADYRQTTIRGVWQGDRYHRLRASHIDQAFGGDDLCGPCPDWQETRWPDTGRSYADLVADLTEVPCPTS